MSILEKLKEECFWTEFLEHKIAGKHLSTTEERELRALIQERRYLPVVEGMCRGEAFPLPGVQRINKKGSGEKRRVFVFEQEANAVLKGLSYLLHQYDFLFSENLYSFRQNIGVKKAIGDLLEAPAATSLYSYKVDIRDYFASVNTELLLKDLEGILHRDKSLYDFIADLLREPNVQTETEILQCHKGIMAGVPISGFLANVYLRELDRWFADRHVLYARYSDDIIVFAPTEELVAEYENRIKDFLREKNLGVNSKKEHRTRPGEPWEFLGFRVDGEKIDLSGISLEKMKDKMRRKAKALLRWKERSGATAERAIGAYIRHFNRKLYDNPKHNEVTWCRWYFPTITTAESLHILDGYMLSCIRYIATGRHTKANFNLRYDKIKELGFRSLVNAYYRYKKTNLL